MRFLSLLMLAFIGSFVSWHSLAEPLAYIDVSGHGETLAYPDYLTLDIQLSATDKEVKLAKDQVDVAFYQLKRTASKMGISDKDIESVTINNYPQWDYSKKGQSKVVGYRVIRPVKINLRNLDNYGAFLEAILVNDKVQINNTQLQFSDLAMHQSKARETALLNARNKAQEMAAVLDQKVTGVLHIQEQSSHRPYPVYMQEARAKSVAYSSAPDPGSSMQIQNQKIEQQVQVRFRIEASN